MEKDVILEKLKKLLALAERGGTEAEAENAMAKAQALLAQYNLSMADVDAHDADPVMENVFETGEKNSWKDTIVGAAARLCFCDAIKSSQRRSILIIGTATDAMAAKCLATYLIQTGEKMSKQAVGDRSFKIAWKVGYAQRISTRCFEMVRAAKANQLKDETTGTDLILHPVFNKTDKANRDFIDSNYKVRLSNRSFRVRNGDGYNSGSDAGGSVSLSTRNIAAKGQLAIGG